MKKLRLTISLALLILIYFTLSTCKKKDQCPSGDLTTDEKSWEQYYENGEQKFVFKCDTLIDTLSAFPEHDYDVSCNGCDWQGQRWRCRLYFYDYYVWSDFFLEVQHPSACKPGFAGIRIEPDIACSFSDYSPQNNVLINGHTYNNVYVLAKDSADLVHAGYACFRIYYTKENGILEFDKTNGQHWVKVN